MVGFYFEKRRALATGVAVCGSGIGTFIFAPLSQKLLDVYNWQGATWIISGVVLNGVILGALFRPLSPSQVPISPSLTADGTVAIEKEETEQLLQIDSSPKVSVTTHENGKFGQSDGQAGTDTRKSDTGAYLPKNKQLELLKTHVRPDQKLFCSVGNMNSTDVCRKRTISEGPRTLTPETAPTCHLSCDQIWVNSANKSTNVERIKQDMQRPLYRKDIFYAGSVKNLPEFAVQKDMDSYIRSITSIPTSSCDTKPEPGAVGDRPHTERCCGAMRNVMGNMMDFSLLRSPTFIVYGLSCFLCMIGFFVPFMFLPDHSLKMGIHKNEAAFLLSILGIANTVARVFSGWLADRPWADALIINNTALLIGGICTMLVPFCFNYTLLAVYSVVFGMCIAAFVSLRSIIMVELMGLQRLTNAFGLVTMCQGLSSFIGAPIAGSLFDTTGDYDISFYFAGATLALAGLICFPLRRISQWEINKLNNMNNDDQELTSV
ncbi:monocarboxylate transporter 12-like isoform X2 [Lineus longissimus]